ncbi:glutamate receptor ionotropic, delta-2-like [Contarinia nasturtii]|uniref:glutamate receptor ionotropic, delta-2-like n=1 Tax=Contarinia nasturtii TaxID=265458 RepID=UPI0012D4237B|nr:glutamate receptor ionotropic, delta-2-like [Contarinia nasturtii]
MDSLVEFAYDDVVTKQPLDDYSNKIWFIVDMKCERSINFVAMSDRWFYGNPYRWVFYDINQAQISELEQLPFLTDSNILIVRSETSSTFILQQFYKIHAKANEVYYESFGTWSFADGLFDNRTNRILSKRRRNLKGRIISVSMVLTHNDSINHLTDYRDRLIDSPSKAAYPVCVHLVAAMNGTANFTVEKTWGYKNPQTGEFDGMTGQLLRKEADIGGTIIYMVPARIPQMDFISMIVDTRAELVFRAPPLSYASNIFYYPFTGTVWIATVTLTVIASIVIYFTYILPSESERDHVRDAFSDVILLSSGLVSQMGLHINPRIISGQISSFVALMCLLFVFTSYTACIVGLLQSTTKSISTLDDILNSEIEVAVQDVPYNRHFIPLMTGDAQRKIYQTKIAPPGQEPKFYNLSYGIDRVREGFFAFYVELGSGYDRIKQTFLEHEKCGLIEISYSYMVNPWFAIQKHSPLKEIIKVKCVKFSRIFHSN